MAALRDEYRRALRPEAAPPPAWASEVAAELRAAVARRLDAEIMRSSGSTTGSMTWTGGDQSVATETVMGTPGPTLWGLPIIVDNAVPPNTMYYAAPPTTAGGHWCQVYDYNGWRYVTPWAPPQGAMIVPIPDLTPPPPNAVPLRDDRRYGDLTVTVRPPRDHAHLRADALLRRFLSPMQLAQFDDTESFEVTGSLGGRFRIRYGIAGNIQRLDRVGGDWIETWCVHPADVPPGDAMLAQKVMLEQDEAHVRARANITHRDGRFTPAAPETRRYAMAGW